MSGKSQKMTVRSYRAILAGGFFACCLAMVGAMAKSAPQNVQLAGQEARILSAHQLGQEAALAMPVSFEVRRLPVTELLGQLEKQSGVHLAVSPPFPAGELKVTARVKDMPLSVVMGTLARLYGVKWEKQADKEYLMKPSEYDGLQRELLRAGSSDLWLNTLVKDIKQRRATLADEVMQHADMGDMKSKTGVPVSALPPALRTKLRREMEFPVAIDIVKFYLRATTDPVEDYTLHIEKDSRRRLKTKDGEFIPMAVTVRAPSGQIIARLVDPTTVIRQYSVNLGQATAGNRIPQK